MAFSRENRDCEIAMEDWISSKNIQKIDVGLAHPNIRTEVVS